VQTDEANRQAEGSNQATMTLGLGGSSGGCEPICQAFGLERSAMARRSSSGIQMTTKAQGRVSLSNRARR
jgi:hypothetical protein